MKKTLLFVAPLILGLLVTSCSNDPKTEPVNKDVFAENLSSIKKQVSSIKKPSGVKYEYTTSLETNITTETSHFKMNAESHKEIKSYKNKTIVSLKNNIKGKTIADGKEVNSNAKTFGSLYSSIEENKIDLLLDVQGKGTYQEESNELNKKICTTLEMLYDETEFIKYKDTLFTNYASFTSKQIDKALIKLEQIPLAELGYIKKDDTEVFTINFSLDDIDSLPLEINLKIRFDENLLTKFEINSENSIKDENGSLQYFKTHSLIKAEKLEQELKLPDNESFENISFKDFDSIIKSVKKTSK